MEYIEIDFKDNYPDYFKKIASADDVYIEKFFNDFNQKIIAKDSKFNIHIENTVKYLRYKNCIIGIAFNPDFVGLMRIVLCTGQSITSDDKSDIISAVSYTMVELAQESAKSN